MHVQRLQHSNELTLLQVFQNPHDVAISQDGHALYVCEIGPNKVWKFILQHNYEQNNEPNNESNTF